MKLIRLGHYYCEDCWYSCPKAEDGCCDERQGDECNCPADRINMHIERLEAALKALEQWDMLSLTDDGHGDAPWARKLIADALSGEVT